MEIQRLFDNLLDSIDWGEAAKNSYVHFHAYGISYINLLRTDRLTVKLYTFSDVQPNDQGFLVYPHTHGYNFTHRTMVGSIFNHKFILSDGDEWNRYSVQSPLNGGGGLTKMERCGLVRKDIALYQAGDSYYLDHTEIHTLSMSGHYAAALLLQFHDVAPGSPTAMFAPAGEEPDCESGLYGRVTESMGRNIVAYYRHMLAEESRV